MQNRRQPLSVIFPVLYTSYTLYDIDLHVYILVLSLSDWYNSPRSTRTIIATLTEWNPTLEREANKLGAPPGIAPGSKVYETFGVLLVQLAIKHPDIITTEVGGNSIEDCYPAHRSRTCLNLLPKQVDLPLSQC